MNQHKEPTPTIIKTASQTGAFKPKASLNVAVVFTVATAINNDKGLTQESLMLSCLMCFNKIFSNLSSVISIKSDSTFDLCDRTNLFYSCSFDPFV